MPRRVFRRFIKSRFAPVEHAKEEQLANTPPAFPPVNERAAEVPPLGGSTVGTAQSSESILDEYPLAVLLEQLDKLVYELPHEQQDKCISLLPQQSGMHQRHVELPDQVPPHVDTQSVDIVISPGSSIVELSNPAATVSDTSCSYDGLSSDDGGDDDDDNYDRHLNLFLGSCGGAAILDGVALFQSSEEDRALPTYPDKSNANHPTPVWDLTITWDPTRTEDGRDCEETDSLDALSFVTLPRF